ncbi:DUF883 family protein [Burkholderiaceae bacterium FT117]|uniref:DUF883 family protein n=1 Tax=Zeimonas sediminis TaxID=2944268 RepID=UPI002342D06E|nr:DUF883 family protein [Zeimonas sediminis]MCM5569302.1 DUF883 family protein [Zeimonas sediminis]
MNEQRAQQKEKLVADIKTVMAELDELVRDSASDVGDDLVELKGRLRDQVDAARQTLSDLEGRVADKAKSAAQAGDEYVREHTWTSIGIAAGIGVVIGLLLNRR